MLNYSSAGRNPPGVVVPVEEEDKEVRLSKFIILFYRSDI
jgi:hypothetical protein